MLVMVVFFISFRWIPLSTPLIRLFLLVLILLFMPTLNFFACLVRFESSSVPTTLPTAYDVYPLDGRHDGGYYTVKDCVTIDVLPRTPGNNVDRKSGSAGMPRPISYAVFSLKKKKKNIKRKLN